MELAFIGTIVVNRCLLYAEPVLRPFDAANGTADSVLDNNSGIFLRFLDITIFAHLGVFHWR